VLIYILAFFKVVASSQILPLFTGFMLQIKAFFLLFKNFSRCLTLRFLSVSVIFTVLLAAFVV